MLRARILARTTITESCWLWTGATTDGYGQIFDPVRGRLVYVHRAMYELDVGPIPDGLELDHVRQRGCVHRHCCNPAHLEPVTDRENVRRGSNRAAVNARKTHCLHGHPFNHENTRVRPNGKRDCLTCQRNRNQQRALHSRA